MWTKIEKRHKKTLQRWGLFAASMWTLAGFSLAPVRAQDVSVDFPTSGDAAMGSTDSMLGGLDAGIGYSWTGKGIGVAVIDSGVSKRTDLRTTNLLASRVVAEANFVPGATSANDQCGHGTHVAGIVAGNGAMSTGSLFFRTFAGVATEANIINVRVLNQQGQGSVSDVIAGIQWAINNRKKHNIRIMNLSLGHPVGEGYKTDPLCLAAEQAWKAGILVVCAAGNTGRLNSSPTAGANNEGYGTAYGSVQSPGNSPYVLTIGAMKWINSNRASDTIATYSSRGPSRLDYVLKPDMVAPGNQIVSLNTPDSYLATTYPDIMQVRQDEFMYNPIATYSKQYARLSGTSMAAPAVAGAAALMLQANPALTPDTVKARLMASADKWRDAQGNFDPCTYGAGYLNIPAALNSTLTTNAFALSPTLQLDPATGYLTVDSSKIIWGTWGNVDAFKIIWGTTMVDGSKVIWGTNIINANKVIWGNHVLWGSQVWSNKVIWGTSTDAVDLSSVVLLGE